MRFVVLAKAVPDLDQLVFDPGLNKVRDGQRSVGLWEHPASHLFDQCRQTLRRNSAEMTINLFDAHAVEEALRLSQLHQGSEVTAISMGAGADQVLRQVLALGVNQAIWVEDPELAGSDTLATARVLGAVITKVCPPVDLILCGHRAVDSGSAVLPARLARRLGIPALTGICRVRELTPTEIEVERRIESSRLIVRAALPALVSVTRGINEPRYPGLAGIKKAKQAQLTPLSCAALGLSAEEVGAAGSRTRVATLSTTSTGPRTPELLEGSADEVASQLIERLRPLDAFRSALEGPVATRRGEP